MFCKMLLEYKIILGTLSCSCNFKFCPLTGYSMIQRYRKEDVDGLYLTCLYMALKTVIFQFFIIWFNQWYWEKTSKYASFILKVNFTKHCSLQKALHTVFVDLFQPGSVAKDNNHVKVSGSLFTDLKTKSDCFWIQPILYYMVLCSHFEGHLWRFTAHNINESDRGRLISWQS